jgi:hypothetical protein
VKEMTRVPLSYPKIPGSEHAPAKKCIAFEKYDGTNLHWVWERELGWYAFGTRRDRFDLDEAGIALFNRQHPGYEDAPRLFRESYADPLDQIFRENPAYRADELTVFTEYYGPHSFAGVHQKDDIKQLVLFDVQNGSQIVGPEQFIEDFGHLDIARVIYRGKLTAQFENAVRNGKYPILEGVVCKGGAGADLWMVKIKTYAYMKRLKEAFTGDWEAYWE